MGLMTRKGNGLFSTVLLDWIEWAGPLVIEAEKSWREGLLPPVVAAPEVVAEHLRCFTERAWRRPVTRAELEDYLHAYHVACEAGEQTAAASRAAMQGVLTSRNFLSLVEGDPVARDHLTGGALASRLSYFLWSSMPDDGLFAAARSGTLINADLEKQVDRMLADSLVGRFIDDFSRRWLPLHRVGMFPPDKKTLPDLRRLARDEHAGGAYGPAHMASKGVILDVTRATGEIPLGSSGIRIRFETDLILEGIRSARLVRVRPAGWPRVDVPREEDLDDGTFSHEDRLPTPAIFRKY